MMESSRLARMARSMSPPTDRSCQVALVGVRDGYHRLLVPMGAGLRGGQRRDVGERSSGGPPDLARTRAICQATGMRKPMAAAGSVVFFVIALGTVAGLIPWWLTGWRSRPAPAGWSVLVAPVRIVGLVLLLAGAAFVVTAFARFV